MYNPLRKALCIKLKMQMKQALIIFFQNLYQEETEASIRDRGEQSEGFNPMR